MSIVGQKIASGRRVTGGRYPLVVGRKPSLVEQVESDVLDSSVSLADALRKCVALGGRAGSAELRDWATRELTGYPGTEVPEYRKIVAPIVIDGISGNMRITGQQIGVHDLPGVAQEARLSEEIDLRQSVGELEHMVRRAEKGDPIRLGLPGAAMLAKLMTHEIGNSYQAVERIYWNVSPTAVVGVLDQIRTRLVALVAEIQAAAGSADSPSEEAVTNAVEVAVYGKARDIHINTVQSGGGPATIAPSTSHDRPWWRTTKAIWAFAVGLATIAAAAIAWLQWR